MGFNMQLKEMLPEDATIGQTADLTSAARRGTPLKSHWQGPAAREQYPSKI